MDAFVIHAGPGEPVTEAQWEKLTAAGVRCMAWHHVKERRAAFNKAAVRNAALAMREACRIEAQNEVVSAKRLGCEEGARFAMYIEKHIAKLDVPV